MTESSQIISLATKAWIIYGINITAMLPQAAKFIIAFALILIKFGL